MTDKEPQFNVVDYVKSCIRFWITSEFYAVGLSSFLGVAIRVGIKNHFATSAGPSNPSTAYGPFMQMFFAQDYLLSNIFGCFLMAMFITNMGPISKFSLPLYKSLTTGLCGCITTYSSWINGTVDSEFRSSWYEILLMIMFEFWLTWSAFTMGYAAAKMTFQLSNMPLLRRLDEIYHFVLSGGVINGEQASKESSPAEKTNEVTTNTLHAHTTASTSALPTVSEERDSQMSMESVDLESTGSSGVVTTNVPFGSPLKKTVNISGSLPRASSGRDSAASAEGSGHRATNDSDVMPSSRSTLASKGGVRKSMSTGRQSTTQRTSIYDLSPDDKDTSSEQTSLLNAPKDINFNKYSARISVWREDGLEEEDEKTIQNMTISENRRKRLLARLQSIRENLRSMGRTTSTTDPSSATGEDIKQRTKFELFTLWFQRYEFYIWCTLFCFTAGLVWTLLIMSPYLPFYKNTPLFKDTLRAISLAPFGAWFRWGLTRIPRIKASWPEMNPQTMIANLAAVTIYCSMVRRDSSYSWNYGIDQGFNGACSTVSTFFAEIHSLYFEKGPMVALRYCMVTFLLSIAIVQIIRS